MKTIKIFLASSEELEDDRNAFGNLVRKLNKSYEKRGIHLELFEWEDYDAAYNDRRKQDEYNDNVRASDMFLAVFHRVAGKFTIEEFDVATEEFCKKGLPKSYVYCKDLQSGDIESAELKEFKKRLFDEMGHYWSRYANRDTMQLHFVMQLQLVEGSASNALKVEDGNVVLDGQTIARMENLPFAGLNEDFQRMSARLVELPAKIEKARAKADKYPDDEDFRDEVQALLNEYNKLKDDFAEYQNNLFSTAKRIAQLQGERITDRMRRAMEAFNEGRVRDANIILEEAERDAESTLQEYKRSKELTEQKRQTVISSIEELLLKSSTMMADLSLPIDQRIAKTEELYAKADMMAQECDYEAVRYNELLSKYATFLYDYAKYDKALEIQHRTVILIEQLYDKDHPDVAASYGNIGMIYYKLGGYAKALDYYSKALSIVEKALGKDHPETATVYSCIGRVYCYLGEYYKALDFYFKALSIRKKVVGKDLSDIANSYNDIGDVYSKIGDYSTALNYHFKALSIYEEGLGKEDLLSVTMYNNIGMVYYLLGDYTKALEYHFKSLPIFEKVLGKDHSDTATSYNNIGLVYTKLGDYTKALEYHSMALSILEKVLGEDHSNVAILYCNIGIIYHELVEDYSKALEYYLKALPIFEKVLGKDHSSTATSYGNIGMVYYNLRDYNKASDYIFKALYIFEKVLGEDHPNTAVSYNNIGLIYYDVKDYAEALKYFLKALSIYEKTLGVDHPNTKQTAENIAKAEQALDERGK